MFFVYSGVNHPLSTVPILVYYVIHTIYRANRLFFSLSLFFISHGTPFFFSSRCARCFFFLFFMVRRTPGNPLDIMLTIHKTFPLGHHRRRHLRFRCRLRHRHHRRHRHYRRHHHRHHHRRLRHHHQRHHCHYHRHHLRLRDRHHHRHRHSRRHHHCCSLFHHHLGRRRLSRRLCRRYFHCNHNHHTVGQNQVDFIHRIIRLPTESGVSGASERTSERTSKWPSTYVSIHGCSELRCITAAAATTMHHHQHRKIGLSFNCCCLVLLLLLLGGRDGNVLLV